MTDLTSEFFEAFPALHVCRRDIEAAFSALYGAVREGNKILVCGNGGSAADSEHIVGEMMKGFHDQRELPLEEKKRFQDLFPEDGAALAASLQCAIPAISLVSMTALITAIANDVDADYVFAQQVFGLGQEGDILFTISTSGNSANVVHAAKVAKVRNLTVIALTGEAGGKLRDVADICVRVPARRVDQVQELHLPVYHYLCAMLEETLFGVSPEVIPMVDVDGCEKLPTPRLVPSPPAYVVFDFDGVFTNNKVYLDQNGKETVVCDRRDGLGLEMMRRANVPMMILSKERNPVVAARGEKLKINVEAGCDDKAAFLKTFLEGKDIDPATVVYMGNDLNDVEAMGFVGYSAAPGDAHPAAKSAADVVFPETGGNGAVRALCQLILES